MLRQDLEQRVAEFGRALFHTGDLDPVYLALPPAVKDSRQLDRWLVAYWCFYSAGAACWLSEKRGNEFFFWLDVAAKNIKPTPFGERWPRGTERRHFRGQHAIRAVAELKYRYDDYPEGMVEQLTFGPMDIRSVIARAREHRMFGDWIAFKIADMIDGVLGEPVKQDDLQVFLYDTPRKSILEHWRAGLLPTIKAGHNENTVLEKGMYWLQKELSDCEIPHKEGQKPDWFSLETVWCKHHSHLTGHYPLYKDIHEIRHGLQPWLRHSKTAVRFLANMPADKKEGFF